MWALTGHEIKNGYLPPEISLSVRLHRRRPSDSLVQRWLVDDTAMYGEAAVAAVGDKEKITWKFKDLYIQYESLTTDQTTMSNMKHETKYFVDIPRIGLDHATGGKMFTRHVVNLPPGSKFVALAWVLADHVYHKSTSNRPLAARFHFPPHAQNVTVGFEGEPGLVFGSGFEELGTDKARNSFTSRAYFNSLVHRKLYSRDFTKMFPKHPERSSDQVLLFELTALKLDSNTKLQVHVKYDATGSPKNYCLFHAIVQQMQATYNHDQPLQWELVP